MSHSSQCSGLDGLILSYVKRSARRQTIPDLVRYACTACPEGKRRDIQAAIARLVAAGELQYAQLLGCTFVELAWLRRLRVSPRIYLCPEQRASQRSALEANAVMVYLGQGSAFGVGDHATTKLALAAMDAIFDRTRIPAGKPRVLDIGTGTGVLAIAAVGLGAASAVALDNDPCALWEARRNAGLNRLEDRIRVTADPVERIAGDFDLILANLRLPTLLSLTETLGARLTGGGMTVVSGIRPEESGALMRAYRSIGLHPCWYRQRKGWAGIAFSRSAKELEKTGWPQGGVKFPQGPSLG